MRFQMVVGCLALAIAACGGETEQAAAPTATPSDRQLAEQAVLRLDDFPPGWQQSIDTDDSSDSRCESIDRAKRATSARKSSPNFNQGDASMVLSTVYVFPDEAAARQGFQDLAGNGTDSCLAERLPAAMSTADVDLTSFSLGEVGDDRIGTRVEIPLEQPMVIDLAFVRSDRTVATLLLGNMGEPFDSRVRADLIEALLGRLPP